MSTALNSDLRRLGKRIDAELNLQAYPHADGVEAGYRARTLELQGYSKQAAWAKAQRSTED